MALTLKDRLLNGKVIGESFKVYPTSKPYQVVGLHIGEDKPQDYACLVVKESDGKEHHYNLATRLDDVFVQEEQTAPTPEASDEEPLGINLSPELFPRTGREIGNNP